MAEQNGSTHVYSRANLRAESAWYEWLSEQGIRPCIYGRGLLWESARTKALLRHHINRVLNGCTGYGLDLAPMQDWLEGYKESAKNITRGRIDGLLGKLRMALDRLVGVYGALPGLVALYDEPTHWNLSRDYRARQTLAPVYGEITGVIKAMLPEAKIAWYCGLRQDSRCVTFLGSTLYKRHWAWPEWEMPPVDGMAFYRVTNGKTTKLAADYASQTLAPQTWCAWIATGCWYDGTGKWQNGERLGAPTSHYAQLGEWVRSAGLVYLYYERASDSLLKACIKGLLYGDGARPGLLGEVKDAT